jgi:hypothetical protein
MVRARSARRRDRFITTIFPLENQGCAAGMRLLAKGGVTPTARAQNTAAKPVIS